MVSSTSDSGPQEILNNLRRDQGIRMPEFSLKCSAEHLYLPTVHFLSICELGIS